MSLRNGDRARAHKIRTKRRLRRMQIRVFRRVLEPAREESHAEAGLPSVIADTNK